MHRFRLALAFVCACGTSGGAEQGGLGGASGITVSGAGGDAASSTAAGPEPCDDGVACTRDAQRAGGCTHVPDDTLCGAPPSACATARCTPEHLDADTLGCVATWTTPTQSFAPTGVPDEGRTLFRYRTFVGARPAWVSAGSTSLALSLGADVAAHRRGPDGGPFHELYVTRFDGDHYLGQDALPATGDVTVEAWFRTSKVTGWQTLLSNTEGGGYSLKLKDGRLRGLYRVQDGASGWADLEHVDGELAADDRWHHAAFSVRRSAASYELCLQLDDRHRSCAAVATSAAPRTSPIPPCVGAEPDEDGGSYTFGSYFAGDIYAVSVKSYVVEASTLAGRVVRDGSRYFDQPSYHDYLSSTPSVDQRINDTVADSPPTPAEGARYTVPFLDDNYVPQGVASSPRGDEIWLSLYYNARHQDGDCAADNPASYPSLLVGFDPCTSETTRTYLLYDAVLSSPNDSHVGGVAVVPGALGEQQVYTTTSGGLARYAVDDPAAYVIDSATGLAPPSLLPSGPMRSIARAARYTGPVDDGCGTSFLSYDASQHRLTVGRFVETGSATLCSYALDGEGELGALVEKLDMPVAKVQGALELPGGGYLLSTSFGDADSRLYRWSPGAAPTEVARGPAGFEDLTLTPDGLVWTVSESGGAYYQKRGSNGECSSSWSSLYPYVLAWPLAALGGP